MENTVDIGMERKMNQKCFPGIVDLAQGKKIDESQIFDLLEFVDKRYDCADFRVLPLVKTMYAYKDLLSETTQAAIKKTLLNFKYWMDEPGSDGMCYWSENHQLIFHTAEYLVGSLYLEDVFTNDGNTGAKHVKKAMPKIENWLKNRFLYGFIEWHSNTYYEEDIAPLILLSDHAPDGKVAAKARIILDLIMLDFASNSHQGYFAATSGRCYAEQKLDPKKADVNDILAWAFGIIKQEPDHTRLSTLLFLSETYKVPKTIKRIADLKNTQLIKERHGLDLDQVKAKIRPHDLDHLGMYMWAMEAFTNVQSINMTMDIFNQWKLQENNFLRDLKTVNIPILRKLGLLPLVVRILNPATQGVAIQQANTYTFKTDKYMLSSVQRYHPGTFGDQQHIWQALLPNATPLFSTHPGSPMFADPARNFSPSYWVGNGIHPDCRQFENQLLLYYDLGVRKGFLERERQYYVHFNLKASDYDLLKIDEFAVYGKIADVYVAILANVEAEQIQEEVIFIGKRLAFAVIISDVDSDGDFESFVATNAKDRFVVKGKRLSFFGKNKLELKYKGEFLVDGIRQNPVHHRYDTPFIHQKDSSEELVVEVDDLCLRLNLEKQLREETKGETYGKTQ